MHKSEGGHAHHQWEKWTTAFSLGSQLLFAHPFSNLVPSEPQLQEEFGPGLQLEMDVQREQPGSPAQVRWDKRVSTFGVFL